jgi:hypothetical protein
MFSVIGLNFGTLDNSATVLLADGIALSTSWSSSTSVRVCDATRAWQRLRHVILTIAAVVGTATNLFTFDSQVVSAAQSNVPMTGGASLTVSGLSFSLMAETVTASLPSYACGEWLAVLSASVFMIWEETNVECFCRVDLLVNYDLPGLLGSRTFCAIRRVGYCQYHSGNASCSLQFRWYVLQAL